MSAFRKIMIDSKEYLWKYTFDDYDYQEDSSLVIKSAEKKGKLIIYFRTGKYDTGYCPFQKGVPAVNKNEFITINLNQPRFVSELFTFAIGKLQVKSLSGTIELTNGIEMLHELGYIFDYEKQW